MGYGQFAAASARRYRDLGELIDYRQYPGGRTARFEEQWLAPQLHALGYTRVRFFGGHKSEYDGSFSERVCEVMRSEIGARPEYFTYG